MPPEFFIDPTRTSILNSEQYDLEFVPFINDNYYQPLVFITPDVFELQVYYFSALYICCKMKLVTVQYCISQLFS